MADFDFFRKKNIFINSLWRLSVNIFENDVFLLK